MAFMPPIPLPSSLPPVLACSDCGHRTYDDLQVCPRCGMALDEVREAAGLPATVGDEPPPVHLIRHWNFTDEQPVCGAPHEHHGDRTVYREAVTCPECRVHPAMESALCQDTGKTAMAGEER